MSSSLFAVVLIFATSVSYSGHKCPALASRSDVNGERTAGPKIQTPVLGWSRKTRAAPGQLQHGPHRLRNRPDLRANPGRSFLSGDIMHSAGQACRIAALRTSAQVILLFWYAKTGSHDQRQVHAGRQGCVRPQRPAPLTASDSCSEMRACVSELAFRAGDRNTRSAVIIVSSC